MGIEFFMGCLLVIFTSNVQSGYDREKGTLTQPVGDFHRQTYSCQKAISLTVLVSIQNNVFYYEDTLFNDASNLRFIQARNLSDVVRLFRYEHRQDSLRCILKIEDRTSINDEVSAALEELAKQLSVTREKLTEFEAYLIKATEERTTLSRYK